MARPRRQDERRRQLVRATAQAIADRGLSGLRLKHIADRAGLSIGSVLYYYPDLDTLLVEVHQQVLDQFYWERVAATDAIADPVDQLVVAVSRGVPDADPDGALRVTYELHVASAREESHAALLTTLWEREVSLYERIFTRGVSAGVFALGDDARSIAQTVVALEDAFDLHLTGNNHALDRGVALDRIFGYLSLVTGCDLTARSPTRPGARAADPRSPVSPAPKRRRPG